MDYEGSMDLLERMLLDPNVEPTSLPLSLLKTITNGFSDDEKIGCGGFADVYKGILQNGTVIAVKKLFPNLDMDEEKFIKEVGCLMKAKNKNIVQFLGYCSDTQGIILKYEGKMIHVEVRHRLLCFEFLPKRSLDNYITDVSEGLEWRMRYKIIKGICEGLHYLHQNRIVHLDLKPANILLTDNMVPRIADFGLARCFDGKQSKTITSKVTGSLGYLAPESHDGVITFKSDIYSLGIIIMEMLTGQKGYCDIQNVLQCWSTRFKSSQEDMWSQHVGVCAEIAKQCIDPNPVDRPGTLNIIERLDEMERTCGFIETDICASSVTKGPLAVALNSSSVKFSSFPIRDTLPGRAPLNVVIVYAFDCCDCTPAWYTVDDGVFWMVQSKLTRFTNSCLGYICFMSKGNKYTSDMKLVDSAETKATGYKEFAGRRMACRKEMASGLAKAHEMIGNQRYQNGIILLFSDGFKHEGDFFNGADKFVSKVPVHTFTLGGDVTYDPVLLSIALNSKGGKFHTNPVPERPNLSVLFSRLLDSILGGTTSLDDEMPSSRPKSEEPLDVVIVYAFDCTYDTPAWNTVDGVFWLVQEKLTNLADSCLGYICPRLSVNIYISDMKLVDSADTKASGYKEFAERTMACRKNMASGLAEAHKMISNRGYRNGIILLFSDGIEHEEDFFDGAESFHSDVPVHTFTLVGDAYNRGLLGAMARNSVGGKFHTDPVPEMPNLSLSFSRLLDTILAGTMLVHDMLPTSSGAAAEQKGDATCGRIGRKLSNSRGRKQGPKSLGRGRCRHSKPNAKYTGGDWV